MYCIGIAGGTASGKSTFIKLLKNTLVGKSVNFISIDDYYKPLNNLNTKERESINFDHPDAIDFNLLETHIQQLKNGKTIKKPEYCFKTHNRLPSSTQIKPLKVLLIEGILCLSNEKTRNVCDYKIFIEAPEKVRFERRLIRDSNERGRTKENVTSQFMQHISPMHQQFVEPSKKYTNLIIDGTKNMNSSVTQICALINQQLY